MTRQYKAELDEAVSPLASFDTDPSIQNLCDESMTMLRANVMTAKGEFTVWRQENDALIRAAKSIYADDEENFTIVNGALSRTVSKVLGLLNHTVEVLPYYRYHPEAMPVLVQHMIDQYQIALDDLNQSIQNTLEEGPEDALPDQLLDLADLVVQYLTLLKRSKLEYWLRQQNGKANQGAEVNPDAWFKLGDLAFEDTRAISRGFRDYVVSKQTEF